jgi:hypothetical protein
MMPTTESLGKHPGFEGGAEVGLESSRLIFALSHTHSAAPLMKPDPSLPKSELQGPWMERVYQAAVSAVGRALADADKAILDWHTERCEQL